MSQMSASWGVFMPDDIDKHLHRLGVNVRMSTAAILLGVAVAVAVAWYLY